MLALCPAPTAAEWLRAVIRFQPTDCASCVESLAARLERVRGVEQVQVDSTRNLVKIQLAAGNRVRLSRLRDVIQQDGTRWLHSEVEAKGACLDGGRLELWSGGEQIELRGALPPPGECKVVGEVTEPQILVVKSQ
jgi:copper chaperone CopZ